MSTLKRFLKKIFLHATITLLILLFSIYSNRSGFSQTAPKTLTISKTGVGRITISPPGIDCGRTCNAFSTSFDEGTSVTLTATPETDSMFAGWTGGCSGTGACKLTMDRDVHVTARFQFQQSQEVIQLEVMGNDVIQSSEDEKMSSISAMTSVLSQSKEIARTTTRKLDRLINPQTDLKYLGAFRVPEEKSHDTSWSYGGSGMTYYPDGDPDGDPDGYPGSLFSISHPYQRYVSEFTIPAPVISPEKNINDLPVAQTLQPFYDVTEGRQIEKYELTDLAYLPRQGKQTSGKLYWVMYIYYMPHKEMYTHGWCELKLSNLQSSGPWRLGAFPGAATSRYLFDIPIDWAETYTPGKYLAAGRFRVAGGGGKGPALYAYGPWNDGNPPPSNATLDAVQLLNYDFTNTIDNFGNCDEWSDGAWLTVGSKSAVIISGLRPMKNVKNGLQYYGAPRPHGTGGKGYHGEPYYKCMLFYDPTDLASVTQGMKQPYEPQPYAVFNVTQYMFKPGDRTALGGVGFDRQRGLLYVLETRVEGHYSKKPIVHVWRLIDGDGVFDDVVPSSPENLRIEDFSSDYINISWDVAMDNVEVGGYVVYRDGASIAITGGLSYRDTKVSPNTLYNYSVAAFDAMNNYGPPCKPVGILTFPGPDSMPPQMRNEIVRDITTTSATIQWLTDEPAISFVAYGLQPRPTASTPPNTLLTTTHNVTLSNLSPDTKYQFTVISEDKSGNLMKIPGGSFTTSHPPSPTNQPPVLKRIGSFRVDAGDMLEFTISGKDPDRNNINLVADSLPEGAVFNHKNGWFGWQPRYDQAGSYTITFTISDGILSDSEDVMMTVRDVNQ